MAANADELLQKVLILPAALSWVQYPESHALVTDKLHGRIDKHGFWEYLLNYRCGLPLSPHLLRASSTIDREAMMRKYAYPSEIDSSGRLTFKFRTTNSASEAASHLVGEGSSRCEILEVLLLGMLDYREGIR
jgi:hypothetical protein